MKQAQQAALEKLESFVDKVTSRSVWFEVDQQRVNQFADVSRNVEWIQDDAVSAQTTQYGAAIVHGYLVLSLMGHIPLEEEHLANQLDGQTMAINYGYNRVRFPQPLKVGSRIRVTNTMRVVEVKDNMLQTMTEAYVEIENEDEPACVAECLRRWVF